MNSQTIDDMKSIKPKDTKKISNATNTSQKRLFQALCTKVSSYILLKHKDGYNKDLKQD